jgi:hypothetical protein
MPKTTAPRTTDPLAVVRKAIRDCRRADKLSEETHMSLSRLYWVVKAGIQLTADEVVLGRLDKATSVLSDSRQNFGDAVYQLEQLLK